MKELQNLVSGGYPEPENFAWRSGQEQNQIGGAQLDPRDSISWAFLELLCPGLNGEDAGDVVQAAGSIDKSMVGNRNIKRLVLSTMRMQYLQRVFAG